MELTLDRKTKGPVATLGDLSIDGTFQCHVLEDTVREVPGQPVSQWKVWGKTAIPAGRFRVVIRFSPHFNRLMPLLLDVPGFTGIEIHWGSTDRDTDGCLIVGTTIVGPDFVTGSRAAFDAFFPKLEAALNAGQEAWITIA